MSHTRLIISPRFKNKVGKYVRSVNIVNIVLFVKTCSVKPDIDSWEIKLCDYRSQFAFTIRNVPIFNQIADCNDCQTVHNSNCYLEEWSQSVHYSCAITLNLQIQLNWIFSSVRRMSLNRDRMIKLKIESTDFLCDQTGSAICCPSHSFHYCEFSSARY